MAEHHRKKWANITRILSTIIENFLLQDITSIYNHQDLSEMSESVPCEYFVLLDIYISV